MQVDDQFVEAGELSRTAPEPRSIAECVRRVVADLLQAGQRSEHQSSAAHAGGLLSIGQQLVDDALVHAGLLARQRRPGQLLDLVGQVGNQRLVGLGPAQQERRRQPAECFGRGEVVVAFDGRLAKRRRKWVRLPSSPGVTIDMIDHSSLSRFSTGVPVSAMCWAAGSVRKRLGGAGLGVLHRLGLVEHDGRPLHRLQRLDVAGRDVVRGDDEVVLGDDVGECRGAAAAGAVVHGDPQHRRESGRLCLPVANDRQRTDHQMRARQCGDVGERGRRLAEAHVVGQASTETELVEELQPSEPAALIRTQRRHEPGRLDSFRECGIGEALQQIAEPTGRGDRRAIVVDLLTVAFEHGADSRSSFFGCGELGGEPQEVERRQLAVVATMFGEIGKGSACLGAVEPHPPAVDVDQPGARCSRTFEQRLVDGSVVDDHGPVDDRRGAEPSGPGSVLRLGDSLGGRGSASESLGGQQFDVDGGQGIDRLERRCGGVEIDAMLSDRRATTPATVRASRCRRAP